jgi:uncharacterized protein YndB with AHSA1/START domain
MVTTVQDTITRTATFAKPIATVWSAITSPENLTQWMCTKVKPYTLAPGELLQMSWNDEHFQDARIVTVDPPHTFAWEWRPGGGFDSSKSLDEQGPLTLVTFSLTEIASGTQVTVLESGFAALSAERHAQSMADNNGGWDSCVGNLVRFLGGSDDR